MAGKPPLWTEARGDGGALLVYLHGLNATGAVWGPVDALAADAWPGRRLLVDLPGHGRSQPLRRYSFGAMAAAVAEVAGEAESVTVVGHSMGGVVALVLASGWYGLPIADVVAFGIKVSWTEEELDKARAVSERPAREFDDRAEAADRFLLVSGLTGLVDVTDPMVASGLRQLPGDRVRLAADPRANAIGAPSMASLMAARQSRVRMACGSEDPLVTIDELRPLDPDAEVWEGLPHNAHVRDPEAVWRTVETFSSVLSRA
jgi:pimeloyl-ACP methyl ester carboxylesterase